MADTENNNIYLALLETSETFYLCFLKNSSLSLYS